MSIYVFNECDVASAPVAEGDNNTSVNKYFLGRPWGMEAWVVFQNSTLSDVITPAGWRSWKDTPGMTRTENVTYLEYGNTGAGADTSQRASFSSVATEAVELQWVLSSSYKSAGYYDASYMP